MDQASEERSRLALTSLDTTEAGREDWPPRRRPVAEPWSIRPSRGSIGEGEAALTVVNVTGHLPTPRCWGTRVSRGGLSMTKQGSFKKAVRRHAKETGQRYTEALTDLEGLQDRMFHQPVAEQLVTHLSERYGIDARGDEAQRAQRPRLPHRQRRRRTVDRARVSARASEGRRRRRRRHPAVSCATRLPG